MTLSVRRKTLEGTLELNNLILLDHESRTDSEIAFLTVVKLLPLLILLLSLGETSSMICAFVWLSTLNVTVVVTVILLENIELESFGVLAALVGFKRLAGGAGGLLKRKIENRDPPLETHCRDLNYSPNRLYVQRIGRRRPRSLELPFQGSGICGFIDLRIRAAKQVGVEDFDLLLDIAGNHGRRRQRSLRFEGACFPDDSGLIRIRWRNHHCTVDRLRTHQLMARSNGEAAQRGYRIRGGFTRPGKVRIVAIRAEMVETR